MSIKTNFYQKETAKLEIFCKDCINTLNIEKCDTCESGSNWEGDEKDERRKNESDDES